MSEDDLVRRLQVGHDSGCAMSYGMHEHCCDCSYPDRQESAETILKLRQDLAAAQMDAAKTGEREAVYLSRIQHLMSELAAARADAERYRWLRTNKLMHNGEAWTWATGNGRTILTLPDLDAAIDAAIAGEKNNGT